MTLNLEPRAGCWGYLIKFPGLSVEFGAVVLAHSHQDAAGWIHRLCRGCLQVPLWAVPLSNLPGAGRKCGQDREQPLLHPWPSSQAAGQLGDEETSDSQGCEERGILRGVHDRLQVIDPAHQEEACEGKEQSQSQAAGGARWGQPASRASGARPG